MASSKLSEIGQAPMGWEVILAFGPGMVWAPYLPRVGLHPAVPVCER